MLKEGLLDAPPMFQFCLGIPWGAPADTVSMKAMKDNLPEGAVWAAFGIGRMQMPMVAQAMLLGGNVRVGLEDNLWLEKGVYASNATLVDRAIDIILIHEPVRRVMAQDEIHDIVDRIENTHGEAMLSRDRARREAAWDKLEQEFEAGNRVEAEAHFDDRQLEQAVENPGVPPHRVHPSHGRSPDEARRRAPRAPARSRACSLR